MPTGKRLQPTEVARKEAMELARAHLGEGWRTTPWQSAWNLVAALVEAGSAPERVAVWYWGRCFERIAAGDNCHQQHCFEKDWRDWTRTGTCPRLDIP